MGRLSSLQEISIYTVVLFFAVLLIKNIFRDKMSTTMHFMIWLIPIARLCIPFTIDSNIRLITIQEKTVNVLHEKINGNLPLEWTNYLFVVWIGGILFLLVRMLVNMVRMKSLIKRYGIEPLPCMEDILRLCSKELGIRRKIKMLILPNATTPALTIGFRPKVVMPLDIHEYLCENQLKLAIKHELMHYKRRDYLIVMLVRILEIVYWFNPVVWIMCRLFSIDMEVACDSIVTRELDNQYKKDYALSLVQLSSRERISMLVLNMVFGNSKRIVEKRVRKVFQKPKRRQGMIIAITAIAATLFFGCFTTAFRPLAEPVINKEISLNYQTIANDQGTYYTIHEKKVITDSYSKASGDATNSSEGNLLLGANLTYVSINNRYIWVTVTISDSSD